MASWRQQALIEAPVEEVWEMIGDPERYPEWASYVVEVTGVPQIEQGAQFSQVGRMPIGKSETSFEIEELDELREIKMRCLSTGFYSRWVITEAQENTFLDAEIGMEPAGVSARVVDSTIGKRWYRRLVDESVDGLKRALAQRK